MRIFSLVGGAFVAAASSPCMAQSCEALTKYGVYDIRATSSDAEAADSYRNWFCSSSFESEAEAKAAGGELGYKPITGSYDSSKETWKEFRSSYCNDDSASSRYRKQTVEFVKSINTDVIRALEKCTTARQPGLHLMLVPGARKDSFYVLGEYKPFSASKSEVTIGNMIIRGAVCNGDLTKNAVVPITGAETLCSRDPYTAVDLSISGDNESPVIWDSPRGLAAYPLPLSKPGPVPDPPRSSKWRIVLHTAAAKDAETNGEILATIGDAQGRTFNWALDIPGRDDRKRGAADVYEMASAKPISEFRCLSLYLGGKRVGPAGARHYDDWGISRIELDRDGKPEAVFLGNANVEWIGDGTPQDPRGRSRIREFCRAY